MHVHTDVRACVCARKDTTRVMFLSVPLGAETLLVDGEGRREERDGERRDEEPEDAGGNQRLAGALARVERETLQYFGGVE